MNAKIDDSQKGNLNIGLIAGIASAVLIALCVIAVILIVKRNGRIENSGSDDGGRTITELDITSTQIDGLFEETAVGSCWSSAQPHDFGE
jgi:predicted RND superfamily exporter protein